MSLNIANLLNTLKGYYNPEKNAGQRYTGEESGLSNIINSSGLSGAVTNVSLTGDALSKIINESGMKIEVSSSVPADFGYKIDEENGKITIFGNNLIIAVDEFDKDMIEVVGISNEVKTTDYNDKVTLLGFDNTVDTGKGEDTVTVYGEDNINIFKGVSGNYLIVDDKEFQVSLNPLTKTSNDTSALKIGYDSVSDNITFEGNDISLIAQSDTAENISLKGNNNYLDTSDGTDNITVEGADNTIVTGDDNTIDTVTINGSGNTVLGENGDIVKYTELKGSIAISPDDNSSHYVEIEDASGVTHKYLIEKAVDDNETIELSYELKDGEIIFTGDNAKIISQGEDDSKTDKIKVIGSNNYIETSIGNDEITIQGNENIIISGEGNNVINIAGEKNEVTGNENDEVYYTSTSSTITLTPEDKATHYIKVNDVNYLVQRNEIEGATENSNITFSYSLNNNGVFVFQGNYFSLIEQNDGTKDNVKIMGDYNYVDTGDEDDRIEIQGDNNVVTAGDGDDSAIIKGNNNEFQGDEGIDNYSVTGDDNIIDAENKDQIFTLNLEKDAQIIEIGDKTYSISLTDAAKKEGKEVQVVSQNKNGTLVVTADDVIIRSSDGQEDKITLYGSNSKIFAMDKNDEITVYGDNNFIDGWSGDDKITATGIGNKAYGFLGNDEINIIQRKNTDEEVENAGKEVYNNLSEEEQQSISDEKYKQKVEEYLNEKNANYVDGEFDTDTVNSTTKNTKISAETEIYTSLSQSVVIKPDESEKTISINNKTYTIKNYITIQNNNPFIANRTISYDVVTDKETGKDVLVIKGDYVSVVAEDGQEDNVKIIGENNYLDLGDKNDYIETEGKYNLLFAGIGSDSLKVTGSNNTINTSNDNKTGNHDENTVEVNGDENIINGGKNSKDKLYVEGNNSTWNNVEVVSGSYNNREVLTNSIKEKTVRVSDGKVYTFKANIADNETLNSEIVFGYDYDETTQILTVKGNKIQVIAAQGQQDKIVLKGDECVINLGDEADFISATGSRNTIYGGDGDDEINIVGESFNVFAEAGNDKVISNTINSNINGGTGSNTINAANYAQNSISGFRVDKNNNEGIVILNSNRKNGTINVNLNGQNYVYNVTKNGIFANDEIVVKYEIKDAEIIDVDGNEKNVKQLIITGNDIVLSLVSGVSYSPIYAKIIGNNVSFETSNGNDFIDVEGDNNTIVTNSGRNTINVAGNKNTLYGGASDDTFAILGDENVVYGQGGDDNTAMIGENNILKVTPNGSRKGGSIVLSQKEGPQILGINVNGKNRTYRLSMYGLTLDEMYSGAEVDVQYYIDNNGYMTFVGEHFKVEVLDSMTTENTDITTTDNNDSIRLVGNNCYIVGSHGSDALKVEGNNNVIDGWYGNDSFEVIGNNNEIRGFYGDDIVNVKGDNNFIDGEDGNDSLTILEGEGNTYRNIKKK